MNTISDIMNLLHAVDWTAEPKSAENAELDGVTAYLGMYARFILENTQQAIDIWTPFASPLKILNVQNVHVHESIVDKCQRLAEQSPLAYDKVFALRALEWAALCEARHPATFGREYMFDPLLSLVINRISAIVRKGYWVIGENMYPLANWVERYGR